jgi:hypothetical protein
MPAMRALPAYLLPVLGLAILGCGRSLGVPPSLPPTLVLVSPAKENTEQDPVQGPFTLEVAPGSGGAVAKVEWWTPGHKRVERPGPPFTWTLDTQALIDGRGVLSIYATPIGPDERRGATSIFTFFVNNTPPRVEVLRPVDGHAFTVGGNIEVVVCVRTAPGQALGGAPTAQVGSGTPIALAPPAGPSECLAGSLDGGAEIQPFTASLPIPLDDASLDGFDLTIAAQDRSGNTDSRVLHLRSTREIWSQALPAVAREVRAYPGGVAAVGADGSVTWFDASGLRGGRKSEPDMLATATFEGSGTVAVASATGASGHEVTAYPLDWNPPSPPAWGPKPLQGRWTLGASGSDTTCFGNAEASAGPGGNDVQCYQPDGTLKTSFPYTLAGPPGAVWLGIGGSRIVAPRFLNISGTDPRLYLYSWELSTGTEDVPPASIPGAPSNLRPLFAHADRYGTVVSFEGASRFIDPTTGAAADPCPTICGLGVIPVAAGPQQRVLWYIRRPGPGVTQAEVSQGKTIVWNVEEPILADIPIGGPWTQLGAFDDRGYGFLALSAQRESYSLARVISYDDAGNRRWHWSGAAHVVGLSLVPDDPAAPVYLVDGDWTVRALVR